jgi:hypothetical protein
MRDDSISFSNEINLLEYQNGGGALNLGKQRPEMSQTTNNTNYQNNTNNKSDNSSIGGGKIIDKKDKYVLALIFRIKIQNKLGAMILFA